MKVINRFYVYLHRRKSDSTVFYIGKGTGKRKNKTIDRSSKWKDIANMHGFYSEILYGNLTNSEALEIETNLIRNPPIEWELVNSVESQKILHIDESILGSYYYDESSPTFLRYTKNTTRAKSGSPAGYKDAYGYMRVSRNRKHFKIHRIIYKLFYPKIDIDNLVINHIDGNKLNNNISNLEAISVAENNARTAIQRGILRSDNKTGVTNITLISNGFGLYYYRVMYKDKEFKDRSKNFSCKKFGQACAFDRAKSFLIEVST